MKRELLKQKIQMLKQDLAMITEDSIAFENLKMELNYYENQLRLMDEATKNI
jgi:hypothetical protein